MYEIVLGIPCKRGHLLEILFHVAKFPQHIQVENAKRPLQSSAGDKIHHATVSPFGRNEK